MIKHIKPLPISEEMIGAYLEGNLEQHDVRYIEQILQDNEELSAFINELSISELLTSNELIEELTDLENNFTLPEIHTSLETSIKPFTPSLEFEPLNTEVTNCPITLNAIEGEDITTDDNISIAEDNEISNTNIDINNDLFPFNIE